MWLLSGKKVPITCFFLESSLYWYFVGKNLFLIVSKGGRSVSLVGVLLDFWEFGGWNKKIVRSQTEAHTFREKSFRKKKYSIHSVGRWNKNSQHGT